MEVLRGKLIDKILNNGHFLAEILRNNLTKYLCNFLSILVFLIYSFTCTVKSIASESDNAATIVTSIGVFTVSKL